MQKNLREHLQALFALDDFRPAQREIIGEVLEGHDVLCVMPTGAGKSLCYQLPTYVQGGLTLVVSPLISLMRDQVEQLRDEGLGAMLLNSHQTAQERRETIDTLRKGFEGLLYVAPERFFAGGFMQELERIKPKFLAIDEAHCISMWGHDFRPEYYKLGEVRRLLGSPPTIALTATATQEVRDDIIVQLGMREPSVYVTGFDRPNLRYACRSLRKEEEKQDQLIEMVEQNAGAGIVYCSTRRKVDDTATLLKANFPKRPIFAYHAGMEGDARSTSQTGWMDSANGVAVATNAFGMGINRPDTRFVVHYNVPGTLEAYYQEAGRGGRDGQPADCVLFYSYADTKTQEFFIEKIGEGDAQADPDRILALKEHARQKLDLLMRYAETHRCRRQMILDYFGDESEVCNCDCDACRMQRGGAFTSAGGAIEVSDEVNDTARKLLAGVARVTLSARTNFGAGMIADVLAGEGNERTDRWGFEKLSVFGLLRQYPTKRIIQMLYRLMEAGLARQRDPDGQKFRPVVELTGPGVAVMKGEKRAPGILADLLGTIQSSSRKTKAKKATLVQVSPSDPQVQARLDRLKAVRSAMAREKQLPAYCVCHDATLAAIAVAVPRTAEALEMIKGMGPNKVRLYGKALLEAVG